MNEPSPSYPYGGGPGGPPAVDGRAALNVPSLLLMIFGGIGLLLSILGLVTPSDMTQLEPLLDNPDLPPEVAQTMRTLAGGGGKVVNLISILLQGGMVYGALQMRNLERYPAAMAAAILGIIPCGSCSCCVTLPVGIWALVILLKPEIKSQFH